MSNFCDPGAHIIALKHIQDIERRLTKCIVIFNNGVINEKFCDSCNDMEAEIWAILGLVDFARWALRSQRKVVGAPDPIHRKKLKILDPSSMQGEALCGEETKVTGNEVVK